MQEWSVQPFSTVALILNPRQRPHNFEGREPARSNKQTSNKLEPSLCTIYVFPTRFTPTLILQSLIFSGLNAHTCFSSLYVLTFKLSLGRLRAPPRLAIQTFWAWDQHKGPQIEGHEALTRWPLLVKKGGKSKKIKIRIINLMSSQHLQLQANILLMI